MSEGLTTDPTTNDHEIGPSSGERKRFTYEGVKVPMVVVVIWLTFLIFGFVYFARFILDQ